MVDAHLQGSILYHIIIGKVMDGKVQRWTDAVCCTCADRAAWLEDYPHIAINTSEQVVVMHFTKKFPEWHSEIVDTPRPSL